MSSNLNAGQKYSSFKKTHGPPYYQFSQEFDPLDHNEYLLDKKVDVEALRSIHQKGGIQTA